MNFNPNTILRTVLAYVLHGALAAIAAFALRHGWHIQVPVVPTWIGIATVYTFVRHLFLNVGNAWTNGKLVAEFEADAKQAAQQVINAAEGK